MGAIFTRDKTCPWGARGVMGSNMAYPKTGDLIVQQLAQRQGGRWVVVPRLQAAVRAGSGPGGAKAVGAAGGIRGVHALAFRHGGMGRECATATAVVLAGSGRGGVAIPDGWGSGTSDPCQPATRGRERRKRRASSSWLLSGARRGGKPRQAIGHPGDDLSWSSFFGHPDKFFLSHCLLVSIG